MPDISESTDRNTLNSMSVPHLGLHCHVILNSGGFRGDEGGRGQGWCFGRLVKPPFFCAVPGVCHSGSCWQKGAFSFTHTVPLLPSLVSLELTFSVCSWIVLFSGATGSEIPGLVSTGDLT